MMIPAIVFWSAVYAVHANFHLANPGFRRALRIVLLAFAVIAVGIGLWIDGEYSSRIVLFIGGSNAHVVETIVRSYAALFLNIAALLTIAAVYFGYGTRANRHPLAVAAGTTVALIVFRIWLEKMAAPQALAMFAGIIWLVPAVGAHFGIAAAVRSSWLAGLRWLAIYVVSTRLCVLVIMLTATWFELGTHFDVSGVTAFSILGEEYAVERQSFNQYADLIFLPQLLIWTTVSMCLGLLTGIPAWFIRRRRQKAPTAPVAAA